MAKGRKHVSDRYLRNLGYGRDHILSSDQSDLVEEDVWSTTMVDDKTEKDEARFTMNETGTGRWLGGDERQVGGLSMAMHQLRTADDSVPPLRHHHFATSAPVNVPDWPKIYRVDSAESMTVTTELDGEAGEWMPPHEYLARREHGKTATKSVFEGVGRTLKGRDMSRVRNAVWRQTGFFG